MLLRRVIEHFRKQEWVAVGIDLVITVLGVFIGIQVANWNDARVDQQRAHSYLERIRSDLQADLANYDNRIKFWTDVSTYGRHCLDYIETGDRKGASAWHVLLACQQGSQLAEYFTTSATYDELRGAGELNLIGNVELRNHLARYYTNAANPVLTERPAYRTHVRGLIPLDMQLYIWGNCYGSDASGEQELRDCASPAGEARVTGVLNRLRADATLGNELRYWMSTMHVAGIIGGVRSADARALVQMLEAEMGR